MIGSTALANTSITGLLCSGSTQLSGCVTLLNSLFAPGFSNVLGTTYSTVLSNSGDTSIDGSLILGSSLFMQDLSNVGGVTYASNVVGAMLTGCTIPFASVTGLSNASAGGWTSMAGNIYAGPSSNVGIGVGKPAYALDVSGDVHATGTMFANAYMMVGGTPSGPSGPSGPSRPSRPAAAGDVTRPGFCKNRIINGDMRIDQRFSGASQSLVNTAGSYIADRMVVDVIGSSGSITAQQTSTPSGPGPGLCNSMLINVASVNSSPAANDYMCMSHRIEGTNLADFGWGTANACAVTVSFWISSSVPGSFAVSMRNGSVLSATRSAVSSFTLSVSNSWTRVVVSLAGDKAGIWQAGAVLGAVVSIALTCGSSLACASSTNGVWQPGHFLGVTGQSNFMGSLGAQVNITGLQLERGASATPFEIRPFMFELLMCRRYFHAIQGVWQSLLSVGYGGFQGTSCITLPTPMLMSPTLAFGGPAGSFGVYQYGATGLLYSLASLVLSPTSSTQDIVLNASWTASNGSQGAQVLTAGMSLITLFNLGAWLSFTSEL